MRISDWSSDVCSSDLRSSRETWWGSGDMDLSIWSIGGVGDLCRRETERRSRFRLLERRIERQGSSSRLPRSYQNAREAKIQKLGVRAEVIMPCTKSDRKSFVEGKTVSVRSNPGGDGIDKK